MARLTNVFGIGAPIAIDTVVNGTSDDDMEVCHRLYNL